MAKRNQPNKAKQIVKQERARANAMIAEANAAQVSTPTRPASIPTSSVDAGSGRSYDYRPINTSKGVFWSAGSMSDDAVRSYLEGKDRTGFNMAGTSAFEPQTAAAAASSKPKSLGQGLRIAGGGGGISKSELDKIVGTKTDPSKVIRQLDKINAKRIEEGKTGISLKSGAANKLIRKASKAALDPFGRGIDFGTGRIGLQLQNLIGDPGSPGYLRQGQRIGAREAVEPTFLAKGMDIGPKGRQQVRGIGKQYEVPARLTGAEPTAGETVSGVGGTTVGGTTAGETAPVEPIVPEEPIDTSLSSGAGGLDLASWATGFKRAKSARQKAGKGAQGLASMKKSPFTSWYK